MLSHPVSRFLYLIFAALLSLSLSLSLVLSPASLSFVSAGSGCDDTSVDPFLIWTQMTDPTVLPPGLYSPNLVAGNSSTYPVVCSASSQCITMRLNGLYCPAQGLYEATICPSGSYCPDTTTLPIACPSGYYCPTGTAKPLQCSALSYCPTGSWYPRVYDSILYVFLLDALLIGAVLGYEHYLHKRKTDTRHSLKRMGIETQASEGDTAAGATKVVTVDVGSAELATLNSPPSASAHLSHWSRILAEGFTRARRGAPVTSLDFVFDHLSLYLPPSDQDKKLARAKQKRNRITLKRPAAQQNQIDEQTQAQAIKDTPVGKCLLAGVTGRVAPGKMTAIMGPSGAGKTTFLNTLMGKVNPSWTRRGALHLNGSDVHDLSFYNRCIGFVPQEDIMHRELTVYENIRFAAQVRLPPFFTDEEVRLHVEAIIHLLKLDHVRDSKIGDAHTRGISGGQRKRVNVGIELAAAPLALFLDEPTSGLDATSALEICSLLTTIGHATGLTVVMVIHQPRIEIWSALDDVLLLAPGGKTCYQGPQKQCVKYFVDNLDIEWKGKGNPADWLMDEIAIQGEEFAAKWKLSGNQVITTVENERKSQEGKQNSSDAGKDNESQKCSHDRKEQEEAKVATGTSPSIPASSFSPSPSSTSAAEFISTALATNSLRGASFFRSIWLNHARSLLQQYSSFSNLLIELFVCCFVAIVMGMNNRNSYQGALIEPFTFQSAAPREWVLPQTGMFISMGVSLGAATAGVMVFSGDEQLVYFREAASGHNRLAYYIGVSTAQLYRFILASAHFTLVYHLVAQPLISYWRLLLIVAMLQYCWYGFASLIAMLTNHQNAALISVVSTLIFCVFNGYVQVLPDFVKFTSAAYWATEALFGQETSPFGLTMRVAEGSAPLWGYRLDWYANDIALMILCGTVYRMASYLAMISFNKEKQR